MNVLTPGPCSPSFVMIGSGPGYGIRRNEEGKNICVSSVDLIPLINVREEESRGRSLVVAYLISVAEFY